MDDILDELLEIDVVALHLIDPLDQTIDVIQIITQAQCFLLEELDEVPLLIQLIHDQFMLYVLPLDFPLAFFLNLKHCLFVENSLQFLLLLNNQTPSALLLNFFGYLVD